MNFPKPSNTATPRLRSASIGEEAQPTDSQMLDWLSEECYYPNDHPMDNLVVLVPERLAKHGAFTLNPENDRIILRNAITKAMNQ